MALAFFSRVTWVVLVGWFILLSSFEVENDTQSSETCNGNSERWCRTGIIHFEKPLKECSEILFFMLSTVVKDSLACGISLDATLKCHEL